MPDFLALHAAVLVAASRCATSYVVGPARPAAGTMPNRRWNFLIAAQSAADCLPSTVTVPYPPSFLRYPSTCFWYAPVGQLAVAACAAGATDVTPNVAPANAATAIAARR